MCLNKPHKSSSVQVSTPKDPLAAWRSFNMESVPES